MVMSNLLIVFLIFISLILLYLGFKLFTYFKHNNRSIQFVKKVPDKATNSRCPICNSLLMRHDKLISRVYGSLKDNDQRCTIHGCPYCYPIKKNGVSRLCPVCGKEIPEKGYLISRLFIRDGNKRHVHVIGCSECNKH